MIKFNNTITQIDDSEIFFAKCRLIAHDIHVRKRNCNMYSIVLKLDVSDYE